MAIHEMAILCIAGTHKNGPWMIELVWLHLLALYIICWIIFTVWYWKQK